MTTDWNMVWTVTIVGIGTVFLTLIVLSFILEQFGKIFNKTAKKQAEQPVAVKAAETVAPTSTGMDAALVAVITAAIASASGQSASSFRIASIKPAGDGFSTPAWGHIDRLQRAPQGRLN